MLTAVAALLAAVLSVWLAAGTMGRTDQAATTETSGRTGSTRDAASNPMEYERVEGPVKTLAPAGDPSGKHIGSSSALCPSGKRVISGGYQTVTGGGVFYSGAMTSGRVGWAVGAVNYLSRLGTVQAFAFCVRSGQAASPGSLRRLAKRRAAARREIEALVARYRVLLSSQRSAAGRL
jgi:hypothetical protein